MLARSACHRRASTHKQYSTCNNRLQGYFANYFLAFCIALAIIDEKGEL